MGILGAGAVAAMQKSIRDNRALLKKRKSLKDVSENYHEKKKANAPIYNKMSAKEFEAFKSKLKTQEEKEKKQRLIILISLITLGTILLTFLI